MSATTMTCLCDRTHEFAEGEFEQTCPCGFVLVLTETVTEGEGDDEPYDIDDDSGTDPYTGGAEDMGFDTGCDDIGGDF